MEELLNKLKDKIRSEWSDYCDSLLLLSKEEIISESYKTSHYGEATDFFLCLDTGERCFFDKDFIILMLEYKGSILEKIYDAWIYYFNPKYVNFFTSDDLMNVIWFSFHRI